MKIILCYFRDKVCVFWRYQYSCPVVLGNDDICYPLIITLLTHDLQKTHTVLLDIAGKRWIFFFFLTHDWVSAEIIKTLEDQKKKKVLGHVFGPHHFLWQISSSLAAASPLLHILFTSAVCC